MTKKTTSVRCLGMEAFVVRFCWCNLLLCVSPIVAWDFEVHARLILFLSFHVKMILNACREPDKIIKIVHNLSLIYLYSCVRHTAFASNKMEHLIKLWLHFFLINRSPNSYFIFTCLWNSGLIVCLVDR